MFIRAHILAVKAVRCGFFRCVEASKIKLKVVMYSYVEHKAQSRSRSLGSRLAGDQS